MVKLIWSIVLLGMLVGLSALQIPKNFLDRLRNCAKPMDYGHCNGKQPLWYYDSKSKSCKPFYYSGCGGNNNRFLREGGCQDYCMNPDYPEME